MHEKYCRNLPAACTADMARVYFYRLTDLTAYVNFVICCLNYLIYIWQSIFKTSAPWMISMYIPLFRILRFL